MVSSHLKQGRKYREMKYTGLKLQRNQRPTRAQRNSCLEHPVISLISCPKLCCIPSSPTLPLSHIKDTSAVANHRHQKQTSVQYPGRRYSLVKHKELRFLHISFYCQTKIHFSKLSAFWRSKWQKLVFGDQMSRSFIGFQDFVDEPLLRSKTSLKEPTKKPENERNLKIWCLKRKII